VIVAGTVGALVDSDVAVDGGSAVVAVGAVVVVGVAVVVVCPVVGEVGNVVLVEDPVRASTVEGACADGEACVPPQAAAASAKSKTAVMNVRLVRLIGSPTLSRSIRAGASGHFGRPPVDDEERANFWPPAVLKWVRGLRLGTFEGSRRGCGSYEHS
jgi:hypothetical protein